MAEKKESDISDVFKKDELEKILSGFDKHHKEIESGKYDTLQNKFYDVFEKQDRALGEKIEKEFGGLDKKMEAGHEKKMNNILDEYYLESIKELQSHGTKDQRQMIRNTQKELERIKKNGGDTHQYLSQMFHSLVGVDVDKDRENSIEHLVKASISNKMNYAQFLTTLKSEKGPRHTYVQRLAGQHMQEALDKHTGNASEIAAQTAFEHYIVNKHGGEITSHGDLMGVRKGTLANVYGRIEHEGNREIRGHEYFKIPKKGKVVRMGGEEYEPIKKAA